MRLAVLFTHPVQYTAPVLRELASHPEIDLTVYYLSRHGLDASFDPQFGKTIEWDIPLLGGYKHVFVPNLRKSSRVIGFFQLLNVSLVNELRRERFDVLMVHGYEHVIKWVAFVTAGICGTRLVLHGESQLNEPRTLLRRIAKELLLRCLFKCFSAFAYIGRANRRYYKHYGVHSGRLFFAPYCVDSAYFAARPKAWQPGEPKSGIPWV